MLGDRLLRAAHHIFILVLVVGSVIALSAQAVVDPRYVEFNASPDHNTVTSDGTPLVERYSLAIYPVGSSVAFTTVNLGKPSPDTGGVIRVDFLPLLAVLPTPGVNFEARVAAVGPGGSTNSTISNTFSFSSVCSSSISPTSRSVAQSATTGSVSVTAGTGCTWSASSNASWITLTGATSGTGNGTVPYSVAPNGTSSQRNGTVTIAGQTFTITQAAMSCTYSLTPTSRSMTAAGGSNTTSVTAPSGCAWTAVSSDTSWLTVTGGASGSGNGVVTFNASANQTTTPRAASISIGGQTFTLNQAAGSCSFSLSPGSQSVAAAGGNVSTNVTASVSTCAWSATSNAAWLTVTTGATGTGNGSTTVRAAANTGSGQRSGTVVVAGQSFSVTQAGSSCTYALSPVSRNMSAQPGTGSASVTTTAGCAWQAITSATWITVTSSGTGSGTLTYQVTDNRGFRERTGTINVGTQVHTVTQRGTGGPSAPRNTRVTSTGGSD
jgi:hypothetical protein